jgi:hypothetical protein
MSELSQYSQFIIVAGFGAICFGCGYLIAFIVVCNHGAMKCLSAGSARYNWRTGGRAVVPANSWPQSRKENAGKMRASRQVFGIWGLALRRQILSEIRREARRHRYHPAKHRQSFWPVAARIFRDCNPIATDFTLRHWYVAETAQRRGAADRSKRNEAAGVVEEVNCKRDPNPAKILRRDVHRGAAICIRRYRRGGPHTGEPLISLRTGPSNVLLNIIGQTLTAFGPAAPPIRSS